jgi:hypothetical protein
MSLRKGRALFILLIVVSLESRTLRDTQYFKTTWAGRVAEVVRAPAKQA